MSAILIENYINFVKKRLQTKKALFYTALYITDEITLYALNFLNKGLAMKILVTGCCGYKGPF